MRLEWVIVITPDKHSANNWLTPDEKERKYFETGNVA